MARTFNQIYQQITNKMVAEYAAVGVTLNPATWSKYSPRRLTCVVVASCIEIFEQALDSAYALISGLVASRKTHTVGWYETISKAYQHGHSLVKDQDYYDNTGLTAEQVEEAQVIKYAKPVEVFDHVSNLKGIRIKCATLVDGELAPVPDVQMAGFAEYIEKVKDAGVKIYKTTAEPDSLKTELDIYYDALVLDAEGKRLDGTNDTPVPDAINDFLITGMEFNGRFITSSFVDKVQQVQGVVTPYIVSIQAQYGELPYADIPVSYMPDAGYMRIINPETDLIINYIPYEAI